MKRQILLIIVAALFYFIPRESCAQIFVHLPDNDSSSVGDFVAGEVIVKFKPGLAQSIIQEVNAKLGAILIESSLGNDFNRIKIPSVRNVLQMVELYKLDPTVEYAEPNYIAHTYLLPNDEYYRYQWNLYNPVSGSVKMQTAWDVTAGSPNVIVAVVDTGVAYENYTQSSLFGGSKQYFKAPDLANTTFVSGYDFVNRDTHPNDDEGHGTHVTGTIAQSTNNAIGTAGIAFRTAIMPVKVMGSNGAGTYANIADGIKWAADHGAKVINLSLGGPQGSVTLENALAYAYNKGVTIVCASGNDGKSIVGYPAAYDRYCIAVGATRFDEARASYSNYGTSLDLVAPGGDLTVDQNQDGYPDGILQQTFGNKNPGDFGYFFYTGTSMATPHVAGIAALLLSKGIATTPVKVREILQSTAKDLGPTGLDSQFGWGLVNAQAALSYNTIANTPPVADVKGPYSGTEDIDVAFDGSSSSDINGDPLTYAWNFGDGKSGSGVKPAHAYSAGGNYNVTLIVNDGKANSQTATTTADNTEVNDAPVAAAGGPYYGIVNQPVAFDGSGSYDPDGTIASYAWDFGDGQNASDAKISHTYSATGNYSVTLTVSDQQGLTAVSAATAAVTPQPLEVVVFTDSFEVGEWNGLWTEDSQNDWFRSNQRAVNGTYSAEIDGLTNDSQLISKLIDLQGKSNATVTFSWLIESDLDLGEYLAFDISTDGGLTWSELKRLRGNVDPEDQWQNVRVDVNNINNLRLRFRGNMSSYIEDADVDNVSVVAW